MLQMRGFRRFAAMGLVAVLLGFAPVFHALCVNPMVEPKGTILSHIMADGSINSVTPEKHSAHNELSAIAEWSPSGSSSFEAGEHKLPANGFIVLVPGLAYILLVLLGLLAKPKWRVLSNKVLATTTQCSYSGRKVPRVNLIALGISRT
jgi:hypothetical protein